MQIDLLGTSFTIQTDEDPQYVQELVDHFRTKVQEVEKRLSSRDPLKTAIVAGVLTTDELFRMRTHGEHPTQSRFSEREPEADGNASRADVEKMEEITQKLIDVLDNSLSDGNL